MTSLFAVSSADGWREFTVGGGGGGELAYVEFTSTVTITASTEGSAQSVVSAGALSFDGSTIARIEFFSPSGVIQGANENLFLELFDGSTALGWIVVLSGTGSAAMNFAVYGVRQLTPSNGSHTYNVKGYTTNGGSQDVKAGTGGAATYLPGFIRVSSA